MLGKLIAGRYEVLKHIAGGGMATVYQGKDTILDRIVAIKVMDSQLGQDDEFIKRFILEAQATGRLSHPNIVNVYDAGEENGTYYMVMEYVEGITLKDYILEKGFLSAEETVNISIQISEGLAHAHSQGIIHRDIKPHNILCTPDGRYKLTDFGIARFVEAVTHLTKTGTVMGSVHYFSPEQASGHNISFPSDLYSLGIVIFEMLTGSVPFDAKEHILVAMMHLHDEVPDPSLVQENLPEALKLVINRLLMKKPEERFQSADQLIEALQQAMKLPKYLDDIPNPVQESYQETTFFDSEEAMLLEESPKSKWKSILIGVGIVLVLIIGYFFWSPSTPKADTDTNTPTTNVQTPAPNQNTQESGTYVVVVGTFQHHENAVKLVARLQEQSIDATIVKKEIKGQKRYRVYAGTFHNKTNAENQLSKVQQLGIEGTNGAYIGKLNS